MRKIENVFGDSEFRMPVPDLHEMTSLQAQALHTLMDSANAAMKHATDMNSALSDWGKEQWDSSLAAARSMAECRSMTDAYGVQLGIVRGTVESSLRHGATMMNLAAKAISAAMTPTLPHAPSEVMGEARRRAAGE
jgi:hypothetical protein